MTDSSGKGNLQVNHANRNMMIKKSIPEIFRKTMVGVDGIGWHTIPLQHKWRRRQTAWRKVREQIDRTQLRNRKARESHHKRMITRLRARGTILECCRCCFLGNRF